jgi:hypothetical protein
MVRLHFEAACTVEGERPRGRLASLHRQLVTLPNAGPKLNASPTPTIYKSPSQILMVPMPMPMANARIIQRR